MGARSSERGGEAVHDPYALLGVDERATAAAIRTAYRDAARRLHPDVNPSPTAAADFARVQAAYELLSNQGRREAFDRARRGEPEPGATEPGTLHVHWRNVAEPVSGGKHAKRGPRGRRAGWAADVGDPTGFEELYRAFFQTRVDEAKRAEKT